MPRYCSAPYAYNGPYAYGTMLCPIRVWASHMRIRVWDVPYPYGPVYAYRAQHMYCPICVYRPIRVWDVPYAYGKSHTRMGQSCVPYEYTRMGRPIRVWAGIRIWGRTVPRRLYHEDKIPNMTRA